MPADQHRWGPAAEAIGAGLFLAYLVLLFAHPDAPSMTDYANWTYQGVLLKRHLLGLADPSHTLKSYPVPNSAATLGLAFFALFLGWLAAAKSWLAVQLLISFLALRHLIRTLGASAGAWILGPQAIFLGVNWWYGFVNFELGLAWVLLFASLLLRRTSDAGVGRSWVLGTVLVLAFFTHMIPFCFCGLVLILYAAQTGRWRTLWQLAPAAALTLWYLAGRYLLAGDADGQAGMISGVRDYSPAFWLYKANSYFKSFGLVNPGDLSGSVNLALLGNATFCLLLLANAVLCVLMIGLIARRCSDAFRTNAKERFLWTAMLLLLPLYLLAPGTALGVSDPGSRLLQTALAPALLLSCVGRSKTLAVSISCAALLATSGLLLFASDAFGRPLAESSPGSIPAALVQFAHVPNHDQDGYYRQLEGSDYSAPVFPTGMFLNRREAGQRLP